MITLLSVSLKSDLINMAITYLVLMTNFDLPTLTSTCNLTNVIFEMKNKQKIPYKQIAEKGNDRAISSA